jgi:hypothetical protein
MASYRALQIVIPVYNDWESVNLLLPMVDDVLNSAGVAADILLADDGSHLPQPANWNCPWKNVRTLRILRLKRNLGHQRAICISLCHLNNQPECERVLIMDGDGEDVPTDIPRLLSELGSGDGARAVFAERTKRSEGWVFSFFYFLYRTLHRMLVGHSVRVGNFSVMNRQCLESLCVSWELWNHYAAAVFASRQPRSQITTARGTRLAGESRMNFPALVMHGLSALSVFTDRISTRLLLFSAAGVATAILGLIVVTSIRLATNYAIPGWATNTFGLLLLLLVQIVAFMLTSCLVVLFTRGLSQFVPSRDFKHFVLQVEEEPHG